MVSAIWSLTLVAAINFGQIEQGKQGGNEAGKTEPEILSNNTVLTKMTDNLVRLKTLKGKFQYAVNKDKPQVGSFYFKKPFQFTITGVDVEQYFNGDILVQYDKASQVYDRRDKPRFEFLPYMTGYEAFFGLVSPLITPEGNAEKSKLFEKDVWVVQLEPEPDMAFSKVFVEQKTFLPLGWSINYKDGRAISIKVTEQTPDTEFSDEVFEFKPPAGSKSSQQVALTENLLPNGTEIPNFSAPRYNNNEAFTFKDYLDRTKGTLLIFWYADCDACKEVIPALRAKIVPLASQKLGAISINVGDDKADIEKRVKEWKLDMPNLVISRESQLVSGFKLVAFPTIYLIGPDGKVWMRSVGYDEQALDKGLKALGFKL